MKMKTTKQKLTGRLQMRLQASDEMNLLDLCEQAGLDKSKFTLLLIRKYGPALATLIAVKPDAQG